MKIYVLGSNPQERGKQLENLTEKILELKGYKKIINREISTGGHEIDLRAVKEQEIINITEQIHLICECKAHVKPTNTTDWLKFLGKLYLEESKTQEKMYACFISLYGVNGNVSGSYEDLKNKKKNIEIITGEDLLSILSKLYNLSEIDILKRNINQYTKNNILNISMLYYNKLYWLVEFSRDLFTILESDGSDIQSNDNLIEMAKDFTNGNFTNIIQEKEKSDIIELYEKFFILILMESEIELTKETLLNEFKSYLKQSNIKYHKNYVFEALKHIKDRDFIISDDDKFLLSLNSINDKLLFYKFLLENQILLKSLNTNIYQKYIDFDLLEAIIKIQHNIILSEEEKTKFLNFIKMSPSSLSLVLYEIDLIVNHRKKSNDFSETMEIADKNILFMLLHQKLEMDFNNKVFNDFYYLHNLVEELEVEHLIKLKDKTKVILENKNKKRLGIGQMADEYNNQLIPVLLLENAPEPWEKVNKT
ncbi:MAG: hypothetical protein ACNI28_02895 [Arcobacter sp.]|uniref:hypothetical protein n=1 Tax=Arcobacter sp. TaxID=1872629 RepID=UPI003B006DB9